MRIWNEEIDETKEVSSYTNESLLTFYGSLMMQCVYDNGFLGVAETTFLEKIEKEILSRMSIEWKSSQQNQKLYLL